MSGSDRRPLSSAELAAAEARAAEAEARASAAEATIAQLRLLIEKLRRELYGRRSERKAALIEQLALELEELQASATEDELLAEAAVTAVGSQQIQGFTRRKPARKPFPEHLQTDKPCRCRSRTTLVLLPPRSKSGSKTLLQAAHRPPRVYLGESAILHELIR